MHTAVLICIAAAYAVPSSKCTPPILSSVDLYALNSGQPEESPFDESWLVEDRKASPDLSR